MVDLQVLECAGSPKVWIWWMVLTVVLLVVVLVVAALGAQGLWSVLFVVLRWMVVMVTQVVVPELVVGLEG